MMELKIADWFRSTSAIAMLQQQRRHQTSIALLDTCTCPVR